MEHEEIILLRTGFTDIRARVDDLDMASQNILKSLDGYDDVLLIEGDNGASSYVGLWDGIYIPKEPCKEGAKVPFVLYNKPGYGLGMPLKFQPGTLRQIEYNWFEKPSFKSVNLSEDTCVLYSDFKIHPGIYATYEQLRSKNHKITFTNFLDSLGEYRNEKQNGLVSCYGDILEASFKDIRVRINALSTLFRDEMYTLDEGDELQIDNSMSGAPSYSGIVKRIRLPPETYRGPPAIPFVLNEYGLGIPLEFEQPTNPGIIYSDSKLSVRKRGE